MLLEAYMFKKEYELLKKIGIVPVIALDAVDDAVPLANALLSGGIKAMEITFRNPSDYEGTAASIRAVSQQVQGMYVGAGTVTNVALAKLAVDSGAQFVVSPGCKEDVVDYCIAHNIVIYPGVNTASEITAAVSKGLSVLKYFPAEVSGGVAMLKALAGPFPDVQFLPSGGLDAENVGDYLALSNVAAISGSWMIKKNLIKGKQWNEIVKLSQAAVRVSLGFAFAHVGINFQNERECASSVKKLEAFGFAGDEKSESWFCGTEFEMMKQPGPGKNGHIGIYTYSVPRALEYLAQYGYEPVWDAAKWAGKPHVSELIFIYLAGDVGGFSVHLKKR